ncbi:uncharacterized protein LOC135026146 [Pseudophryne corroboree]|uniref:uncharacterized protein LOC135026146 n=1 Tax=Pseudophryne corroboree TaxID=495146 RepID=UPI00308209EB
MILDTEQKRVFLPVEKAQELQNMVRNLLKPKRVSVHQCTRVLGKMMATYEAIPFCRFHARTFQWDLLDKWSVSHLQIQQKISLSPRARVSLLWWLQSAHLLEGRRFGIQDWVLVTTDASLRGWGAVTQGRNFQGIWSSQEACLHINVLELRAIYNGLRQAENLLRDLPVLIQSDNVTAVAHVNRQGGTRSRVAMAEATRILCWAESHVSALSAVFIPGVDNWEADFLSRHDLHPGKWGLHQEVFAEITSRWGLPQIDMMASRLNKKLRRYCARSRDPRAVAVDALVTPWVFQSVCVPSSSTHLKDIENHKTKKSADNTHCPRLASKGLVFRSSGNAHRRSVASSPQRGPVATGALRVPRLTAVTFDGMAVEHRILAGKGIPEEVIPTLIKARKEVTAKHYHCIWRKYVSWCKSKNAPTEDFHLGRFLHFLQTGVDMGLKLGSIKVQILALSIFFQKELAPRLFCKGSAAHTASFCASSGTMGP